MNRLARRNVCRRLLIVFVVSALGSALLATTAAANHLWGDYHWAQARQSSAPGVTIKLGNNLTTSPRGGNWQNLFRGTATAPGGSPGSVVHDWTWLNPTWDTLNGDILDAPWENGRNLTNQKRCKAYGGQVEVCNARYGYTGWLGIAQIWLSGSHITQGTAKVNDTYLDDPSYGDAGRQHVLCQEVAHTFGLGHQSEDRTVDLNTCMDYSRPLNNPHPNAHDNEQINAIYRSHDDPVTAPSSATDGKGASRVRRLGRDLYETTYANGVRILTHVTWVDDRAAASASRDHLPANAG